MWKSLVRDSCPPVLLKWLRSFRRHSHTRFEGDYASWEDAKKASTGYDSVAVLKSVHDAVLKVKHGEAIFERDSVCFYHEEFRWPALACLLSIAAKQGGRLNVLDFGGSLGSFYFQHKKFFSQLKDIRWAIVEQEHFVKSGRYEFEDEVLKFYDSIDACLTEGQIDVIFVSSVLQYLEQPYGLLANLGKVNSPYLLIDRTVFIDGYLDRLSIQHVPDSIYRASYPAWFFSRKRFETACIEAGYQLITEFSCDEDFGIGECKGIFLERV